MVWRGEVRPAVHNANTTYSPTLKCDLGTYTCSYLFFVSCPWWRGRCLELLAPEDAALTGSITRAMHHGVRTWSRRDLVGSY